MKVPGWYELVLLALASYRVWRLLAEDTVLDRPRAWVVGLSGWQAGQRTPVTYRESLAEFLTCSSCFGFWVSVVWFASFQLWEHGTIVASVPFAISALLIGCAVVMSDDE